jgi:flavin-dependent dehydrogenase
VRLPWPAGESYPTGARVFRRARFDAALNAAALAAGAEARTARVADVTPGPAGTVVRYERTAGSHTPPSRSGRMVR